MVTTAPASVVKTATERIEWRIRALADARIPAVVLEAIRVMVDEIHRRPLRGCDGGVTDGDRAVTAVVAPDLWALGDLGHMSGPLVGSRSLAADLGLICLAVLRRGLISRRTFAHPRRDAALVRCLHPHLGSVWPRVR